MSEYSMLFPWKNYNSALPGQLWDTSMPASRIGKDKDNENDHTANIGNTSVMEGYNYLDLQFGIRMSAETFLDMRVYGTSLDKISLWDENGNSDGSTTPKFFGLSIGGSTAILSDTLKGSSWIDGFSAHCGIGYYSENMAEAGIQRGTLTGTLGISAENMGKSIIGGEGVSLELGIADITTGEYPMTTFKGQLSTKPITDSAYMPTFRAATIQGINNDTSYYYAGTDWELGTDGFKFPVGLGYDSIGSFNANVGVKWRGIKAQTTFYPLQDANSEMGMLWKINVGFEF